MSPSEPDSPDTIVHLLRHGEVHNPEGILYGRRDGFHLSELGNRMAERIADEHRGPRHRAPARLPAGAGAGDGPAARRRPAAWRSSPTSG